MTAQTKPQCLLPISTTQTARGLIRLYARLKGELEKHAWGEAALVQPDKANEAMEHIEALMPMLGVDFAPMALRPVRTRPHIGPLRHGELRRGILASLRASRDWMTYEELAAAVLRRNRAKVEGKAYKHFLQKLREATHVLRSKGLVQPELVITMKKGEALPNQRWRLADGVR